VLNFIVLTRKELRSHINQILAALAVSDFVVMLVYVPYALDYAFTLNTRWERLTYGYAHYILIYAMLSQTAHTVSIFLTIILALWRYVSVCHPNAKNSIMKRTLLAILSSYFLAPLISLPYFLSLGIASEDILVFAGNMTEIRSNVNFTLNVGESGEVMKFTKYTVYPSKFAQRHNALFLWVYSVIIKLLPCIALTYFSLQLIRALYEAKKRKEKLTAGGTGGMSVKLMTKKKQADRTTRMLIAVLLLFLLTEFPQGIMGLFSAILHHHFYTYCYQKLGDLMDFLALLNSSINFILYCTMSRQFRETFTQIFVPRALQRRARCGQSEGGGAAMRALKGGPRGRQNGFVEIEDSQGDHIEATMAETQATQL
jgi:Serpentine type 7TM GPCR chemoreceptor Srw